MLLVNCDKQDKEDYCYLLKDKILQCEWVDRESWSESFIRYLRKFREAEGSVLLFLSE